MKNLSINDLLKKYWKAETSIEEEEILKSYFAYGEVAPEHEAFRPLFGFFAEEKIQQYQKALAIHTESENKPAINWQKRILSMAATFLVLIAAVWFFNLDQKELNPKFEMAYIENPNEALDLTVGALALLGDKLNHSSVHVKENIQYTDKMNIIKPNN